MAEKKTAPAKKRAPKKAADPVVEAAPVAVEVDAAPVATVPTHDQIARRAYELYCERGGSAFDNWIAAERELSA
ncbi:MAG: DUF2934 domain-containing protein [Myxococcota bacterium]